MKGFIFGLITGLSVGGAIGYFVTKRLDEDYINEEMHKLKEYYKDKEKTAIKAAGETVEKAKEVIVEPKKKIPDKPYPKEYKNLVRSYAADDGIDRDKLKEDRTEDAPEEYYEEDPAESEHPKEDRPEFELIDIDELGELTGYDESCVMYYTEDNTYAYEDNEEMIEDPRYLFGDVIDNWADNDEEKDNIFVRNNRISTDFEVCKVFGSYGDLNAD